MRRVLLFVAALLIVLAIAAVVALQPLRSTGLKTALEDRLSATLGERVSIGSLGITLTPHIGASAEDVRVGDADAAAPALAVDRLVINPRLRSLIRGDLRIQDLELRGFVISAVRDADGRWHLPALVPAPTAEESADTVVERVQVTSGRLRIFERGADGATVATAGIDDLAATMTRGEDGLRLAPLTGRIGSAAMSGEAWADGTITHLELALEEVGDDDLPALFGLLGADRPDFLHLGAPAGITAAVRIDRATSRLGAQGHVRAPDVRLGTVLVQRLESPFTIEGETLTFSPVTCTLYSGACTGTVTIHPVRPGEAGAARQWKTDGRTADLDLGGFLQAVTGRDQQIDGTAEVTASMGGRVGDALDTMRGRAHLVVSNGVIRDFALLAAIDRAAGLTQQQDGNTAFERLTATFDVADRSGRTDDLAIAAQHVQVRGAGRVGADRALDFQAVAVLSPERSAQAVASVRELSRLRNARGEVEIPLAIGGSLTSPEFSVDVTAAMKQGLQDELRRRLMRIIKR